MWEISSKNLQSEELSALILYLDSSHFKIQIHEKLQKWEISSNFLQSEEDSVFNTISDFSDCRMSNLIKPTLPQGHLSDDTNRSLFQL